MVAMARNVHVQITSHISGVGFPGMGNLTDCGRAFWAVACEEDGV
jgi:hypothetical protein